MALTRNRRSDVAAAAVAPGEVALAERQRLDHVVSARFRVRGVVSLLRFAAPDVTAGRADAQVERRAATLALVCPRRGGRAVEMRTGWRRARRHGCPDSIRSSWVVPLLPPVDPGGSAIGRSSL